MSLNIQAALKGQYHAALAMLRETIDQCPDDLWNGGAYPVPYWRVAYHALFFTHLYLQPNEKAFTPWALHQDGCHYLGREPNRSKRAKALQLYTKAQIMEYWTLCDALVDAAVDTMDLEAQECGFHWYTLPKLDHQINNIRHLQHHAALLAGRLRQANGTDTRWLGSA